MSIWKGHQTEKLSIVCDIGSASVSAGLILFSEGNKPVVLYTVRIPLLIQESPDTNSSEQVMIRFLEETFKHVVKEMASRPEMKAIKNKKVEDVYAVYSSPWYVSKSTEISISKKEPFILDKNLVDKMIKDEEKKFEEEAISGTYDSVRRRDIKMIERELVRIKLNGYETSNPFLKGITSAELSLYMSLVPHSILLKTRELVEKYFHTKTIFSNTFPLVSYGAVGHLFPHESDYILLDVAGEMTDVSLVRNGVMIGSDSYPIGRNSLIRAIGKKLKVLPDIALSFIDLKASGGLEEATDLEVSSVLNNSSKEWHQYFIKSLNKLSSLKPPPLRLFISVDTDISNIFLHQLKEGDGSTPRWMIIELNPALFAEKLLFGKYVFPDPFISLETIFIAKRGYR